MDWLDEVEIKIRRKNQILFDKNSGCLTELSNLIQKQTHRTLVLWAFEFADEMVLRFFGRYPGESRLEECLAVSRDWAAGKLKMSVARRAILQAHALAKELDALEDIAMCHAVGQACSVVHTKGHALGLPMYELTALVRQYGIPECKDEVEKRVKQYIERLSYWEEHYEDPHYEWADFLMRD